MKFGRRTVFLFLLSALPLLAQSRDTYQGHDVVANQAIFRLNSATNAVLQQLQRLTDADDLRPLIPAQQVYVLHSRTGNITALLAILRAHPDVGYVEPDYIVNAVNAPNDPNFSQQWSFRNTAVPGADISAVSAWDTTTGSTAKVIGVVDTGIDYTHPDLAPNVWSAPAAFTVTLSWGQITCPAGSHGYNAIARSCDPRDDNQHGTHVSGTIGAAGNNAAGVAGVNWTTRIMGLKALNSSGGGSTSDAIDAIEFAIQAKAVLGAAADIRVLSNSWGGSGYSTSLFNEINRANTSEMLFVAAAGNSSLNTDISPIYPAAFKNANLISVAATTNSDTLASFSNYGSTTISLGAPGVNILSTLPGGAYGYMSGTSMATPHVSGAAMLVLSKCALNTASLRSTLLAQVDPLASLAGITVTGGRLNVAKALRSCASGSTPSGSAAFVRSDSSTAGNWRTSYGADGRVIVGDSTSLPAYVAMSPAGNGSYTWAASTSDSRALLKAASSTDRVSACWYASSAFTIDLNFSDSAAHQVALYLMDWDNYNGGRSERIDVIDGGTGATLDSRTASGFYSGQYLVWSLGGHVVIRVTNTNPSSNSLINGLFFGGGAAQPGAAANFVKADITTKGSWKGVYGADGFNIIGDSGNYPAYATVTPSGNDTYTWAGSTTDVRGVQKASGGDRIAACWYAAGVMTADVRLADSNSHQVALYLLDWDNYTGGRTQLVEVLDGNTNAVLDSRAVYSFSGGQYLVWNLSGHVIIRITNTNGAANAVISGLFFGSGGSAANAASYVKTDSFTSGTWKGVYGADGALVIGDSAAIPSYASVTPAGNATYTWAASTADSRAPQKVSASDRIAACWYTATTLTVDVRLTDGASHQIAMYLLDWDAYMGGRSQRVEVLDGDTGAVLDARTVSGFSAGQYLVWNSSGHVVIRVTNLNAASNALVSGLFFR